MIIYNYDKDYKYYIDSSEADPSPLEPGVFLIPANSTSIQPPNCLESEIQIFDNNSWTVVTNNIGIYYNIETRQEIYNPDPLVAPEGFVKDVPPAQVDEGYDAVYDNGWTVVGNLEKLKEIKLKEVDEEWNTTVQYGWTTPYGWKMGVSIQDVSLLSANFVLAKEAVTLGISDPVFIIDTEGESHAFNFQDLTVLMLQYGQARAALSAEDSVKRTAIKNATTIEELNNF
jgi:hypothetical protein